MEITKQTLIGDLIATHPSAAETLLRAGVHCVGCGANTAETIEEGLASHGMEEAEIEKVIDDIKKNLPVIHGKEGELLATETALTKLKEILKTEGKKALKMTVITGGCSGYQYSLELTDEDETDAISIEGVHFVIDKKSKEKVQGATIDYIESLQGAGFKITNPNAQQSCGCGQSFH